MVSRGFTMVELLVTLVLLGLIAGMVAPGLDSWVSARKAAALRLEISSEFAMLPLIANRSGKQITINLPSKLNLPDAPLVFTSPVIINDNGFCLGGSFELTQNKTVFLFDVLPPYCEVKRVIKN
jgi:prepilin-type N-terminal cleavage/methylation domain-containing protein